MNPLIWTTIYGDDSYFKTLQISLGSLVNYGNYQGDLCLFSDRSLDETLEYVPESLWSQTIVLPLNDDKPSYKTRWSLVKFLPESYEPILHVDTDVVFDATIEPVLHELFNSKKMSFSSERMLYPFFSKPVGELEGTCYNAEFFGLSLFTADNSIHNKCIPCINAGIFGSPNLSILLHASECVIEVINSLPPEYYDEYTDQPAVNYVMTKNALLDEFVLDRYMYFTTNSPSEYEIRVGLGRRGFCHFIWAKGDQKYEQMETYLERLKDIL